MSVVLQKHSHHLVLGFSPPNNCKTKSSPTPAYFSPTPVVLANHLRNLSLRSQANQTLTSSFTWQSVFLGHRAVHVPTMMSPQDFQKAHMQTHHTSEGMVVCCMMNYSALRESESCNKWSRFRANPSSHLFKWNRSPPQRGHGGGWGHTNRSKRPVA